MRGLSCVLKDSSSGLATGSTSRAYRYKGHDSLVVTWIEYWVLGSRWACLRLQARQPSRSSATEFRSHSYGTCGIAAVMDRVLSDVPDLNCTGPGFLLIERVQLCTVYADNPPSKFPKPSWDSYSSWSGQPAWLNATKSLTTEQGACRGGHLRLIWQPPGKESRLRGGDLNNPFDSF